MAVKSKSGQKKIQNYYDYSLVFLTLFLVVFGLLMMYSTSSYSAQLKGLAPTYYLKKQGIVAILGIIGMFIVSKLDYRLLLWKFSKTTGWLNMSTLIYFIALMLQSVVLKLLGKNLNGSTRWIYIFGFSLQPSEISKIAVIIFVAWYINTMPKKLNVNNWYGFVLLCIILAPILILVASENLSTGIIIAAILFLVSMVASKKIIYFIFMGIAGVAAAAGFVISEDYRMERFEIWLDVENHENGYQILQGLYAIASGGIFGKGLGESMQKLGFIPEAQNDMIFSVICEELGLVGATIVLFVFIMLGWRILIIAMNAPDLFGSLICVGVLVQIIIQVILNVAVVTNSMPSTGVPMPFISYGGTALLIILVEIGLVLSVSGHITHKV